MWSVFWNCWARPWKTWKWTSSCMLLKKTLGLSWVLWLKPQSTFYPHFARIPEPAATVGCTNDLIGHLRTSRMDIDCTPSGWLRSTTTTWYIYILKKVSINWETVCFLDSVREWKMAVLRSELPSQFPRALWTAFARFIGAPTENHGGLVEKLGWNGSRWKSTRKIKITSVNRRNPSVTSLASFWSSIFKSYIPYGSILLTVSTTAFCPASHNDNQVMLVVVPGNLNRAQSGLWFVDNEMDKPWSVSCSNLCRCIKIVQSSHNSTLHVLGCLQRETH